MGYMIDSAIAGVGIWIVSLVFKVAAFTFKIFMILAQSDILEEIEYGSLIENFYVLLGIIMLFVMAFSLLRGMVNPDDQKQGTSVVKKMIINFVVSCLILGFLPTIFQFGYDIQNSIIRWNVIGGFFGIGSVGNKLEDNDNIRDIETSAYTLVNGVYTAFFNVSNKQCTAALADNPQPNPAAELQYCQEQLPGPDDEGDSFNVSINGVNTALANNFAQYIAYVDNSADFGIYGAFRWAVANDDIEFNFILLLIAGIALIYIGVSYCFDMALRLIKLIFYQLIAPIPIFLRVIPDSKFSGTFNKWIKVTLTCWMEVFVRIFIFYFCVYLCYSLSRSTFLTDTIFKFGWWTALFTKAFLLMGIVMFMKRSPKLLSEITGIDSGNMKLGIREKLAEGGGFVAGAAIGAGATALTRNAANAYQNVKNADGRWAKARAAFGGIGSIAAGGLSGFVRGGKSGMSAKNFDDAKKAASTGATGAVEKRAKRANYRAAHGGTLFGAAMGHVKDVGRSARNYIFDQSVEGLSRESQSMGKIVSSYNAFNDNFEALLEKEQAKGEGSVFFTGKGSDGKTHTNGFNLSNYARFDTEAKNVAEARAKFNAGKLSKTDLVAAEAAYTKARDEARDELMDIALAGTKNNKAYDLLNEKARAAMQGGMIDAEKLQATILENANTKVVQDIMGTSGSNALNDIANNKPLTTKSFINPNTEVKLKDAAKVAQGQADIKIAEMNKENAAKGDKK